MRHMKVFTYNYLDVLHTEPN